MYERNSRRTRLRALGAGIAVVAGSLAVGAAPAVALPSSGGALFTISNDASGNEVLVYRRAADGSLTLVDTVATGGLGSGGGLGSQGAVTLSDDGKRLLVVNAGSDSLSMFRVNGTHLSLKDVDHTRGDTPISVDVHGNLAFVVNAGSSTIEGFRVGHGRLVPLRHSVRQLSGDAVGPAQVEFSPSGRRLAVTEKVTNQIVTFPVGSHGWVGRAKASPSAGETPFGFEFDPYGRLVVSEAFGGAPGAGTVSTYSLRHRGGVAAIDTAATTQTAACWIAVTDDGAYVYTTNTGSASVTSYRLAHDGTLSLLAQTGVGDGPIDLDFSTGDRYLYVLNGASDSISVLAAGPDGSLSAVDTLVGLPATGAGIAAS
jgi:6-phosphogluconolactonase (cycloisomerase 2 family)